MPVPMFSIILPTYNRAWILPKTLGFICAQSFQDWELVVVDDGSTDETKQIVKMVAAHDPRVRYIFQKNARQAAARQNGLEHALGEWVTYVDSDEEIYPYYLETMLVFVTEHQQVLYGMSAMDRVLELHDAQHKILAVKPQPPTDLDLQVITLKDFAHWKIKPCGTCLFHRRDIVKDARLDTSFRLFEDVDFLLQLGLRYPNNFGYIPKPLFYYRQIFGSDGICGNASYGDWADGFEKFFLKYEKTWLMLEQTWYPTKVEQYRERQRLFEAGQLELPAARYFSEYFKK